MTCEFGHNASIAEGREVVAKPLYIGPLDFDVVFTKGCLTFAMKGALLSNALSLWIAWPVCLPWTKYCCHPVAGRWNRKADANQATDKCLQNEIKWKDHADYEVTHKNAFVLCLTTFMRAHDLIWRFGMRYDFFMADRKSDKLSVRFRTREYNTTLSILKVAFTTCDH